jgi:hypothetical protein
MELANMKITLLPDERSRLRSQLASVHYVGARLHGSTWLHANEAARAALLELGLAEHFDDVLIKTLLPVAILRVLSALNETGILASRQPEKRAQGAVMSGAGHF